MSRPRVLFLCTGNSCRSQMAEGWLRHQAGDRFEVFSAGTQPQGVNSDAVRVMQEAGVDISRQQSKSVSKVLGQHFAYVVTVCDRANEACPIFPGAGQRLPWPFEDPAHAPGSDQQRLAVFRRVRDAIADRIRRFAGEDTAVRRPGAD